MVETLSLYERFYRVSTIIIFSKGFLGRLNLIAENRIGLVVGIDSKGLQLISIKAMRYKLSKRIYR